jgi:hypothetical protein
MNAPVPTPPTAYHIDVFISPQGRQIVRKTPVDAHGVPLMLEPVTYEAQDLMLMRVRTPQGAVQEVQQPFSFEIPDCVSLADAFARWDLRRQAGAEAFIQSQKLAALRQGVSVHELPSESTKR